MGWCSGTELFDKFCEIMFEPKDKDFNTLLKEIINEQGSRGYRFI